MKILISILSDILFVQVILSFQPLFKRRVTNRVGVFLSNEKFSAEENVNNRRVLQLIRKMNESMVKSDYVSPIWDTIRYEATVLADADMKAATIMNNAILSQPGLNEALFDILANELDTPLLQATQIRNLFADICASNRSISLALSVDLVACAMRDHTLPNAVSVLLFHKGFHSLVTYRFANVLWNRGQEGLARYFQSLASRTYGADIHPACRIGTGCFVASGSDIVIGETATIGLDCCISHGVTLGGTGKESGNRHPKVGNGVFLGAGATVLGNIKIGDCSVVNAGSVVTKPVEPFTRVGGVPAKVISRFKLSATIQNPADVIARISEKKYQQSDVAFLERFEVFNDGGDDDEKPRDGIVPDSFPAIKINYHSFGTGS